MTDVASRNRIDEMVESFERRARENGRTFEEEVKFILARKMPLTPEERVAVITYNHSHYSSVQPSMTLDEIREGLM